MTLAQVVLVDQTHQIDASLLHSAALALNNQVIQDLPQYWPEINATVSYAPSLASVPPGAWPVFLVAQLPPGEGGFHLDKHNQPFAKVIASPDDDSWTMDASHEIIEMLVDPFGNRMQTSQAIQIAENKVSDGAGVFSYLVEACDPCEANKFAYEIAGIAVSDFITPHFYEPSATSGARYSFKANVTRPRELLPGGYISYVRSDGTVEQILWVDPTKSPQYKILSIGGGVKSMREAVHTAMGPELDDLKHHSRRDHRTLPNTLGERVADHRKRLAEAQDRMLVLSARYGLKSAEQNRSNRRRKAESGTTVDR
jgi:hypothetical protein